MEENGSPTKFKEKSGRTSPKAGFQIGGEPLQAQQIIQPGLTKEEKQKFTAELKVEFREMMKEICLKYTGDLEKQLNMKIDKN